MNISLLIDARYSIVALFLLALISVRGVALEQFAPPALAAEIQVVVNGTAVSVKGEIIQGNDALLELEYWKTGGSTHNTFIQNVGIGNIYATVSSLDENQQYYFRLRVSNNDGDAIREGSFTTTEEQDKSLDGQLSISPSPSATDINQLFGDGLAQWTRAQKAGDIFKMHGETLSRAGPHVVRAFKADGTPTATSFFAYDQDFLGDVHVAVGDVDGDGIPEIITGAGPGGGPHVRAFEVDGTPIATSFFAYDPGFDGGVHVAVGDVDGDGVPEIITGAGPGGGPHVRAFEADGTLTATDFFAYDPGFDGGVHVAVGDIDGDGVPEIITGAGPGGGPHVRAFEADGTLTATDFFAYDPGFDGGVHVAVGDIDGDGVPEIITGAGPGGGPHVRAFEVDGTLAATDFFAYGPVFDGGVHVAAGDVDGDGVLEIITGAGPGGGPHVRAFEAGGTPAATSFVAYDQGFDGGVHVAAGDLDGDGVSEIIVGAGHSAVRIPAMLYAFNAAKLKLSLEVRGLNCAFANDSDLARKSADADLARIDKLYVAGGKLDYLSVDGPIRKVLKELCLEPPSIYDLDGATTAFIDYIEMVNEAYPEIIIGYLPNYPNWDFKYNGVVYYGSAGGDYSKKSGHTLDEVMGQMFAKAAAGGVDIGFVETDNPFKPFYTNTINCHGEPVNDPRKVKALESYSRKRGVPFGLIFNSEDGGYANSQQFYEETLAYLGRYAADSGSPDFFSVQSWYPYPNENIPETEPHTFMNLVVYFAKHRHTLYAHCNGPFCVRPKF